MHVVHGLGTGGTEEGIRKLLLGLNSDKFEQVVCTIGSSPSIDHRSGARVLSLAQPMDRYSLLIGKLARIIRCERPHIVHSRNWGAIEAIPAARLAGVKAAIHSEHGLESDTYQRQPWRRKLIRRMCFRWANRVFTVSAGLKDYYVKQLGIRNCNIDVIPNGVDTDRFSANEGRRAVIREKLGARSEMVVIGTVGRLDPIKDHLTLLKAAEMLELKDRLRLIIVGDGATRGVIEASLSKYQELGKRTVMVGATDDVVSYLSAFDIFVLPSLAEGMSNALLEAMSMGLACVASRTGGNPELIEDRQAGMLFEPRRAAQLADCLRILISNQPLRQEVGANARRRVEATFSLRRMLSDYAELYLDVATREKRSIGRRAIFQE